MYSRTRIQHSAGRQSFRQRDLSTVLVWLAPNFPYALLLVGVALESYSSIRIRGSILVGDLLIGASGILILAYAATARRKLWLPWWLAIAATTLGITFCAQVLGSSGIVVHDNMVSSIVIFFSAIAIPIITASQSLPARHHLYLLVCVWLGSALFGAFLVLLHKQGLAPEFLKSQLLRQGSRYAGLTMHPNNLGFFLAVSAPLCFALTLGARRALGLASGAAAFGLLLYVIDLTGSRTALVSATLSCLAVAALFLSYRRKLQATRHMARLAVLAVGGLLVLMVYRGGQEGAINRLFGTAESATLASSGRSEQFDRAVENFWENPLVGIGYGQVINAHNLYVSSLECGGLLGLTTTLMLVGGGAAMAFKLLWIGIAGRFDLRISVGLGAAFAAWILTGLRESTLGYGFPMVLFGLMALALIQYRREFRGAAADEAAHVELP